MGIETYILETGAIPSFSDRAFREPDTIMSAMVMQSKDRSANRFFNPPGEEKLSQKPTINHEERTVVTKYSLKSYITSTLREAENLWPDQKFMVYVEMNEDLVFIVSVFPETGEVVQ